MGGLGMTPVRCVGYCRVSTADQAEHGVSLAAQAERIRGWATAYGAEIVEVVTDAGVSGTVPPAERIGLARCLDLVATGEADGIVALKLDRLSRRTTDVLQLVEDARRQGWRLVSVSEQLDTGTAAGRLVVTVLAALAEMERDQIAERTVAALDQVRRQGRAAGHRVPFGWRTPDGAATLPAARYDTAGHRVPDTRQLVEHPAEQAQLARMAELQAAGMGATRIARALGVSPRTGRQWNTSTLRRVLATVARRARAC